MFGRYILVESIGSTTTGELWLALDPDLDRKVALELLRQTHLHDRHARERLLAAARSMARLRHPNVVVIHDVGEIGGQLFLAMEYIDGRTLDQWLADAPHPWQEVAALMAQAGAGLAAAHDAGLVHRDVQPANIVIGADGRVRVRAFGLARPEGLRQSSSTGRDEDPVILESQGESGRVLRARPKADLGHSPPPSPGAAIYMSPEQHRGDTVDARSDLFCFCVILFEALYGTQPFVGPHRLDVIANIMSGDVVEIPADERAPGWIHDLVLRGLAPEPSARFEDMHELLAALTRSPGHTRRRRLQLLGAVGLGVAVVAAIVALTPETRDPCDDQLALAPAWDPSLNAAIDERTPPGSRVGVRLSEGFEARARAWSEVSAQLCRDEQAKRITPGMLAARERCLAEHRVALETLVELAREDADAELLDALAVRPWVALRGLGDALTCAELGPSDDRGEPLDDGQLRAQARLALIVALEVEAASELAEPELARLPEPAHLDGRAERSIALQRGRLAALTGDLDGAEASLHEVAQAATGRDPRLASRAWLTLVDVGLARAERQGPATREALAGTARLLDYAEALADPNDRVLASELALRRGRLGLALADPSAAMPRLDAAIEDAELDPDRDPDLLAAMLELRSQLHRSLVHRAADEARAKAVLQAAFGAP